MLDEKQKLLFDDLRKSLPKEGEERTKKQDTKKGYDTSNWGYIWYSERLNALLGPSWSFDWKVLKEIEGKYKSGTPFWEITAEVSVSLFENLKPRACVGIHTSTNYGDALKGAITNGFKKAAAFWGVGWQAYAGVMDDDAILPEKDEHKTYESKNKTAQTPQGRCKLCGGKLVLSKSGEWLVCENHRDGRKHPVVQAV